MYLNGIQFHLFEVLYLCVTPIWLLIQNKYRIVAKIHKAHATFYFIFLAITIGFLLQLLLIENYNPTLGILKYGEIFFVAYITHLYCDNINRFKIVLYFVCALLFFNTLDSLYTSISYFLHSGNVYKSLRMLNGYWQFFLYALTLPFCWSGRVRIANRFLLLMSLFSLSRAVVIGVIILHFSYIKINRKKINIWLVAKFVAIVFILIFIFWLLLSDVFIERIDKAFNPEHRSNMIRYTMITVGFDILLNNLLFGIGVGNTQLIFEGYDIPEYMQGYGFFNGFLQVAVEQGLYGLICLFSLLYVVYNWLIFATHKADDSHLYYSQSLYLFFIAINVYILFGFLSGEIRFLFGVTIGLIISLRSKDLNLNG